ncbi:hypothetical protein HEP_00509600, partial [Hepatocystis sp. ex Piliocolobus tephrosceles]
LNQNILFYRNGSNDNNEEKRSSTRYSDQTNQNEETIGKLENSGDTIYVCKDYNTSEFVKHKQPCKNQTTDNVYNNFKANKNKIDNITLNDSKMVNCRNNNNNDNNNNDNNNNNNNNRIGIAGADTTPNISDNTSNTNNTNARNTSNASNKYNIVVSNQENNIYYTLNILKEDNTNTNYTYKSKLNNNEQMNDNINQKDFIEKREDYLGHKGQNTDGIYNNVPNTCYVLNGIDNNSGTNQIYNPDSQNIKFSQDVNISSDKAHMKENNRNIELNVIYNNELEDFKLPASHPLNEQADKKKKKKNKFSYSSGEKNDNNKNNYDGS